jgi:hypothetical protein
MRDVVALATKHVEVDKDESFVRRSERSRVCAACRRGALKGALEKWLGHSSYMLTLTTHADYIRDVETENPLPEPVAAAPDTNVVNLFG